MRATSSLAFADPLGRMEKMTSLRTCAMSPCCASTAIFVLSKRQEVNKIIIHVKERNGCDEPVFDALGELVLFFFLLILLQISCYEEVKGHANDPYLTAQPQFIIFVFG